MPSNATKTPKPRGARAPKRFVTPATKLESVDDSLGPLGPLGDNSSTTAEPEDVMISPPPGQNRQLQAPSISATSNASLQTLMGSVHLADDDDDEHTQSGPRVPPPVQPALHDTHQRQTQPSVSLVEAAKPTFYISVGDPHKVGDLTSVHTEYMVSTKVYLRDTSICSYVNWSRPLPRHTGPPNSPSRAVSAIFSGFTTNYMRITPA